MAAEGLSDEELRRELTSHGFNVGPITETTRKVLLRKLNNLRENYNQLPLNRSKISSTKRASSGRASMPPVNSESNTSFSLNSFSSDESEPDDNHNDSSSFDTDVNTSSQSSLKSAHGLSSRVTSDSNSYDNNSRHSVNTANLARPSIRSYSNGPGFSSGTVSSAYGNSLRTTIDSEWRRLQSNRVKQSESGKKPMENEIVRKIFDWHHTWQIVSGILIVLALVFAVAVIACYIYITGASRVWSSNSSCRSDEVNGVGCTPPNDMQIEKHLIDSLVENLDSRAGAYDCGYTTSRRMSKGEFETFIRNSLLSIGSESDVGDWIKKIYCLIIKNSLWNVSLWNENDEVVVDCDSNIEFLESKFGRKSFWCRLLLSAQTVFLTIAAIVALFCMGVALTLLLRQRQKWAEVEQQEVFDLVEKIVDILKQNADAADASKQKSTCGLPYLAIAHVRDSLIPLHLRQEKQVIWDKAVLFLSANESRVRVENQKISGEDFEVWRWIQPTIEGHKVWQGQAFGEASSPGMRPRHRSSVPSNPLTTCLKIRNMFDLSMESGVEWHKPVEDAVLDKCDGAAIVHIAVDTSSADGCIYVRCRDLESAGITFKSLHGWWFDGRLVTVKYLREHRYEERYPASRNASEPLQPSNKERLSLSRPFHSSVIENS